MSKNMPEDPLAALVRSEFRMMENELVTRLTKALRSQITDRVQRAFGAEIKKPAPQRIKLCLSPGCKKKNRGPRFRYLCVDHEKMPQAEVDQWRIAAGFQPEPRRKKTGRKRGGRGAQPASAQ